MKILCLSLIILPLLLGCEPQELVHTGNLNGTVSSESSQPLTDVRIELKPSDNLKTRTNSSGHFTLENIPAGTYMLTVVKEHYLPAQKEIRITKDQETSQNFILKAGAAILTLSDTLRTSVSQGGKATINVTSNSRWTANSPAPWITVSSKTGNGNGFLSFSWSENTEDEARTGIIEVSTGDIIQTVKIKQSHKLKLLNIKPLPGNGATGTKDSVLLVFNKDITSVSVRSTWERCEGEMLFDQAVGDHLVKFSYTCAELGGSFPFKYEVKDADGEVLKGTFDAEFYGDKIQLRGRITDYFVDDKSGSYWVVTQEPAFLYQVNQHNLQTEKQFPLNFEPTAFTLNPYNNSFYILTRSPAIYVLDPSSGVIKKTIILYPDEHEHPQHQEVYAFDIGFTNNGFGIILQAADGISGSRWKVIDSKKDDKIHIHPDYDTHGGILTEFSAIHQNYDKSQLLMTNPYGSATITVYDQSDGSFTDFRPPSITRGVFIRPNRKNSTIYSGQLYNQLIVDLTGAVGKESFIDNRDDGSADFSYRENEENIMYFCDNSYFQVMDYNTAETPVWYDVIYGLRGTTTTPDGKFVIMYKIGNDYLEGTTSFYSEIFILSAELFH